MQTLHAHTTLSDGLLDHKQILDLANELGIEVVAFTEHDTLPDEKTIAYLRSRSDESTKWIIGIEISSALPKELGGNSVGGLHIIGLFVDPYNEDLLEHCRKGKHARIDRMQKIVKNLQSLGFVITEDMCLQASGGESVGRPHITKALLSVEANKKVLEELAKPLATDEKWKPMYDFMIERGITEYPYILLLDDKAYYKGVYVDYQYAPTLDETVALIRNAGGVSILAHYHSIKHQIGLDMLENIFRENRLDGAEVVWGLDFLHGNRKNEILADRKAVNALVQKYNKLASGCVDAHNRKDYELFAENIVYANQTNGMAQTMIKKANIISTWTSIKN